MGALDCEFKCPFCSGAARATLENGGTVYHTLPYCKRFEELDALEFMRAVNDVTAAATGTTAELAAVRALGVCSFCLRHKDDCRCDQPIPFTVVH